MNSRVQIGSLFYQVKDTINNSTDCIVLDKNDRLDPDLLQKFLGKELSDDDSEHLKQVVKSLPSNKVLELSL